MSETDGDDETQVSQTPRPIEKPQPAKALPEVDEDAWEGFALDDTVFRHGPKG